MNPEALRLLREAARWRLLGLLLECPDGDWRYQLSALAAEVDNPVLQQAVETAQQEGSIALYSTTFGPGGPVAPREVSYRGMTIPGQLFGELNAYYQAFGYEPACGESPDHIAVELGFVAYLCLKEAYARQSGHAQEAAIAAEASASFLTEHLKPVALSLAEMLSQSEISYLIAIAQALYE